MMRAAAGLEVKAGHAVPSTRRCCCTSVRILVAAVLKNALEVATPLHHLADQLASIPMHPFDSDQGGSGETEGFEFKAL
jgi:hypothetical protein